QIDEELGGTSGPVAGYRPVGGGAPHVRDDRVGQRLGRRGREVDGYPRTVPLETMPDVNLLFEVVQEGDVEKGAAGRGELHRGGEPTLNDGEVAGGEVSVQ